MASFRELAGVLRGALRGRKGWRLDDVVTVLAESANSALAEWRRQVSDAERELAEAGVRLSINVGRIEDVSSTGRYRVALADGGTLVTVAANAARSALPRGMWVTRDLVVLGARRGELLVPTVAPALLAELGERRQTRDADEAALGEMLRKLDFQPVAVPVVDDSTPESETTRGDVVRPRRRLQVRANRALYAGANTMARSRRPTTAR